MIDEAENPEDCIQSRKEPRSYLRGSIFRSPTTQELLAKYRKDRSALPHLKEKTPAHRNQD